jgi:hypothetical protein
MKDLELNGSKMPSFCGEPSNQVFEFSTQTLEDIEIEVL